MPKSSVFLRLKWPSTSSDSNHEVSSVLSSSSSVEQYPTVLGVTNINEKNIQADLPTARDFMKTLDCDEEAPCRHMSKMPLVKWTDIDPDLDDVKETNEVLLRSPLEVSRSKRITRSLSASSATVSTNTDPEDFLYACLSSQGAPTLPRKFKAGNNAPRIIIPTAYKNIKSDILKEDCQCVDIPFIDLNHTCLSKNVASLSHLVSQPKKVGSKDDMFGLAKGRAFKPGSPSNVVGFKSLLNKCPTIQETIREDPMPDILSNCNIQSVNSNHSSLESLPNETIDDSKQHQPLKKSVKFMLPPEYCDTSFVSEGGDSFSGEYPPSGYAELDNSLMPPNGQNPYRNTPSPAMHGVPNDRYDGGYEVEGYPGEYPDEGGFRGGRGSVTDTYAPRGAIRRDEGAEGGGFVRPEPSYQISDAEVYGRLRGQYPPVNGSHPYEDDLSNHRRTPQPSHTSPGSVTPSMGVHLTHDTYAPSSLLRSPSADSTSRVRWRDPDLHEVVDFLSNPNNVVKANAAAYLQHLCYMDDATKQKTRILGGIPPLVALLSHDLPELHRNACGALRNLSYGRQNDENKRSIKEAGGIPALIRLIRKTRDNEVKELVTGILWNLSSSEELKQNILDDALAVLVSHVIIPCSGWDGGDVERDPNNDVWWSTVFKNASGIIRNISSAGEYARSKLRHCPGLVDALFCVIKLAITGNSHDNKSVENCVCILRNLSYRCQEVEDPNYDKQQLPIQSRATATGKGDNLGCFGGSRKKKEMVGGQLKETSSGIRSSGPRGQSVRGMELLWQPELVVQPYLALLSDCSNPETLEAAAGAIQNLAACYWQPSIDVRAAVRKDKGLPILVELLRMEVDRVVCAVATALRNLAIDQRNKELIGKYAMRDLVQKLPSQNSHDTVTSDETIAAVLATLNEVIKKNAEFSRSLLDAGGVDRLFYITKQRVRYASRVVKFASQVLFSMWGHQELREVYKKSGWKEQDFVSKSVAARNAAGANSPTANNTLNRPMASQGGTRYEDRTIQRSNNQQKHHHPRREEVPLADLGYGGGEGGAPAGGKPGEPVYAKVNREKKRNRHYEMGGIYGTLGDEWSDAPPAYSAVGYSELSAAAPVPENNNRIAGRGDGEAAGDSWV